MNQTKTCTFAPGFTNHFASRVLIAVTGAILLTAVPGKAVTLVTENFDSMGPSGTSLPSGWSAGYLGPESSANRLAMTPYAGNGLPLTNMPVTVSDASILPTPNIGTVMNLGLFGGLDRALGGYPRTTPSGDHVYQIGVLNTTGGPLTEITIKYAGEQWNQAQGTSSSGLEMLRVLVSSTSPIDGFSYFSGLDFVAPFQGPGAVNPTPLNGDDPANRIEISATITLPNPVPDGGTFYVRWHDWNDNGTTDHFLGIDDILITGNAIPEPGTILLAGAAAGLGLRRRRTAPP